MSRLDLQEIRAKLDQVDSQITELFEERMKLCADVTEFKRENGKAVYDPVREKEKLDKVSSMAKTPFTEIAVRELFAQMMTISRRFQYQQLGAGETDMGFRLVEHLPTADAQVVYQGVEGAYSHEAARQFW